MAGLPPTDCSSRTKQRKKAAGWLPFLVLHRD